MQDLLKEYALMSAKLHASLISLKEIQQDLSILIAKELNVPADKVQDIIAELNKEKGV
jgi:energy-converting hydrogenase A subunit M